MSESSMAAGQEKSSFAEPEWIERSSATGPGQDSVEELESLRRAFDRAFAAAPALGSEPELDYVLVTAGGQGYALPAAMLSGIEDRCPVTSVPSSVAALAGIAGVRGVVVPVFYLALLLGGDGAIGNGAGDALCVALARVPDDASGGAAQPAAGNRRTARRFGQEAQQVGLMVETLERFARVGAGSLLAPVSPGEPPIVPDGGRLFTVVDVAALVARLCGSPVLSADDRSTTLGTRAGVSQSGAEEIHG